MDGWKNKRDERDQRDQREERPKETKARSLTMTADTDFAIVPFVSIVLIVSKKSIYSVCDCRK
jgi:hypothetical protein